MRIQGGPVTGDVVAEGYLKSLYARGGFPDDIIAYGGNIGRVLVYGHIGGNITASDTLPGASIGRVIAKGGDILGNVTAEGSIGKVSAIALYNGGWVGGDIGASAGPATQVSAGTGIRYVSAVGGDVWSDVVTTTGDIRTVAARGKRNGGSWTGGDITASISAPSGSIRSVLASKGDLDLTNDSIAAGTGIRSIRVIDGDILGDGSAGTSEVAIASGNLGRLIAIRGGIDGVKVDVSGSLLAGLGRIGSVKATGTAGIVDSIVEAEGSMGSLYTAGDFYNSSVQAGTLRRVVVRGQIYETTGGSIHADTGRFSASDIDEAAIVEAGLPYWFSTVMASVGP